MMERISEASTIQGMPRRRHQLSAPLGRLILSLLGLLVSGGFASAEVGGQPSSDKPQAGKPTLAQVDQAIALSAGYLERACGPDGKFVYEVEIGTGKEIPSYYVLRHEGAIYALAMLNHSHHNPEAVEAMVRAARFLRENYIGPGARPDQSIIWTNPLINGAVPPDDYAELGGTSLGIVALAEVRKVRPEAQPLEQLQALGRFALSLQRQDGSFIQKYSAKSGPVSNWQSLFYPGEAALGFIALYEADHAEKWLIAAGKALSYLARNRAGSFAVPVDHWALIATARLLPHCQKASCGAAREELVRHAIQTCDSILQEQIRGASDAGLDGAFDPDGRIAPAATRLEGLLAALEFLPNGEFESKIETAVGRGIGFLLRTQIDSGPQAGGMPGAINPRLAESSDIRIDFVQHTASAWLRYQRLFQITAESH
jgi:hypothetical protein